MDGEGLFATTGRASPQGWVLARAVAEVKNLYEVWGFVHTVVDQDRGVHQLAHTGTPRDRTTDVGEAFQEINVVQYGVAEPFGGRGKVSPRVREDFLKIR